MDLKLVSQSNIWRAFVSVIQVGLVDKTGKLDAQLVQEAAAALNIQVMRDLTQFWNVTATVQYLPNPKQIPVGVWPVFLDNRTQNMPGSIEMKNSGNGLRIVSP